MSVSFEITLISEAIAKSEQLPSNGIFYVSKNEILNTDTRWDLLTEWDWDEDEDPPEILTVDGVLMEELLPVDPFQQVVWNALEQCPNASEDMMIPSLKFYCDQDAFIDFEESENSRIFG